MRNERVYEITTISVFVAILVVMALVPMLGFVQIGPVALTLLHIPVLIGGIFGGRKVAISLGLVFGLLSLFVALTRPALPADFIFQNPLVSVLPRVLFGWALYEIYVLARRYITNKYLAVSVSMVVSTLVHAILVLIPFYFFAEIGPFGQLAGFIVSILAANTIFEALLAGLIGGPLAQRLIDFKDAEDLVE
jgi:uncharacterized membrane protein